MATREDMTSSRYGRDTCPVCDRSIRLLKDGTIGPHGDKIQDSPYGQYRGKRCQGWKQKPKED